MPATDTSALTATRGYSASKAQLHNRLRRIEGQVRGLQGRDEADRWCPDILQQIAAVQAALDKVALGLLDQHAHHCIVDSDSADQHDRTEELMSAVGRLMRRG